MENMIIEMLEKEIKEKQVEFIILARRLAMTLNYAAQELEDGTHQPNSLGVVQGSGAAIDVVCGQLDMAKWHLKKVRRAMSDTESK